MRDRVTDIDIDTDVDRGVTYTHSERERERETHTMTHTLHCKKLHPQIHKPVATVEATRTIRQAIVLATLPAVEAVHLATRARRNGPRGPSRGIDRRPFGGARARAGQR